MSAFVENGLRSICYGDEFSMGKVLKETITSVAVGTAAMGISYGVNKLTSKITNKLFIKAPNYSQYQHYFRGKGFNYTSDEVYKQMYKHVKSMTITNEIVDKFFDFGLDFLTSPF